MNIYNLRYHEELIDAVDSEIICNDKYCPFYIRHLSTPSHCHSTCEGGFCEEAFDRYLEGGN